MKKGIKRVVLLVAVILGVFTLTGCQEKKTSDLVGKWASKDYDGVFIYTFNEDGTGTYELGESKAKFTWETDGNKISILYEGDMTAFESTYEVKNDRLNIKDSNNEDTIYIKK